MNLHTGRGRVHCKMHVLSAYEYGSFFVSLDLKLIALIDGSHLMIIEQKRNNNKKPPNPKKPIEAFCI
jgi:hypothetical protein